jgi:hypothetical protein
MVRNVLILTHSADRFVVERVAAALERRGARAWRFDTDAFPARTRLSARRGGCGSDRVALERGELELADVAAVWARKVWTPHVDERLEPRLREGAVRESAAALRGFFDGLHGARWVDALETARAAENKLRQLRLAEDVGLDVPRTLTTNDPDAARAFCAEHGEVVAKMLTPLSFGMEASPFFVRTSRVRADDLAHLDDLRHAPMVFQELVPKALELRVACVGERAFAGAIDASRSERGQVDWRAARPDEVSWTRAELPADVAARLYALLARLGLRHGAVDLIRTPDARHVFLEVNPTGEWGMLERDLDLPIADALAQELTA